MVAAVRPERRRIVSHEESIQSGREVLKCRWEGPGREGDTDAKRGVPAPAAEKPCPDDATLIDLTPPEQLAFGRMPVAQAIKQRRSRRQYTQDPLSLDELSFLLWATQGIQKSFRKGLGLRTVPAGGARHPFETYLSVHRVAGLNPGLYRYLPLEHKLCLIYLDDHMAERTHDTMFDKRFVRASAVAFIWTTIPYRKEWSGILHRTYKGIAIDAGHVCQNLYLASEAIGAGTCAVGGYLQDKLDDLLGVDGEEEFAVYVAPVGKLKSGRAVEWSGQIDRITREEGVTRMWVKSFSFWEGDEFVVEFPPHDVSGYAEADNVAIRGEIVAVCSSYDGWPLVRGTEIERIDDPDAWWLDNAGRWWEKEDETEPET